MSRRRGKRGDGVSAPATAPEPRPAGVRKDGEPYHIEDGESRWIEPKRSKNPNLPHQQEAVRWAIDLAMHVYRPKVEEDGSLTPGDAEYRIRGLHDVYHTLKWFERNEHKLKAMIAAAQSGAKDEQPAAAA
jgi:hypothetical protein